MFHSEQANLSSCTRGLKVSSNQLLSLGIILRDNGNVTTFVFFVHNTYRQLKFSVVLFVCIRIEIEIHFGILTFCFSLISATLKLRSGKLHLQSTFFV